MTIVCERCYGPCLPGESYAKLGHIVNSTTRGVVYWGYTYVHEYDRGCVRSTKQ